MHLAYLKYKDMEFMSIIFKKFNFCIKKCCLFTTFSITKETFLDKLFGVVKTETCFLNQ